jgi:catechol 2,3-dioxygenase-like lactoylglutathione lyase family enzyme
VVRFNRYEPRIPVADLRRTIAFYTQTLGFREPAPWPVDVPESFTILYRDQVGVGFTTLSVPGAAGAPTPCELHFEVDDVSGLYEALKDKSIVIWGPGVERDQDGQEVGRRVDVRDPDGHFVIFFEPTYRKQGSRVGLTSRRS